MNHPRFTLSLFTNSEKPAHHKTVNRIYSPTWEELESLLCSFNWSPAVFNNGIRNLTNYKGHPHLFAFDIDSGMTLEEAKEAFKDYQCLIQTSRNHQKVKNAGNSSEKPACDRFRVVFVLSEPLEYDEDFKATFDAYADHYPLDPQTKNAAGFFFRHTQTIFNNSMGKPLKTIKASEWNEVKSTIYTFVKDSESATRGKISSLSQDFLIHGAPSGMFNLRLFKCAVDHLEQRFYEHEFLDICAKAAQAGAFQPLDSHDLATVRSAYNREPKYGLRAAGASYVEAQMQDIVNRIMEGEFIQCIQPDHTVWYRIKDYENKEVEMIKNEQILDRHIDQELKKPENHYKTTAKGDDGKIANITKKMTVKQVKERWSLAGEAIHVLPEPILWRGVDAYCHKRFAFNLEAGLFHPAWDEFTSRLSEPEVFKAWVFSCFVPNHETRQALWLHGSSGEDGKTKVISFLASLFGSAHAAITGGQLKDNSRFFLSQFVGKRLAVYPDCMSPHFPQTESFRNLTGGDVVTLEFKGGGFIHSQLKLKLLLGSNFEPTMSGANYDQSRMLLIDVAPSMTRDDPGWPAKLEAEFPAFLGDCQIDFKQLCRNNGKILVPAKMNERLLDVADTSQERFGFIFDENFRFQEDGPPEGWITAAQLYNLFIALRYQNHEIDRVVGQFRKYLEVRFGIKKRRRASDQQRCYYGLMFKDKGVQERFEKAGISG